MYPPTKKRRKEHEPANQMLRRNTHDPSAAPRPTHPMHDAGRFLSIHKKPKQPTNPLHIPIQKLKRLKFLDTMKTNLKAIKIIE